MLKKHSNIQRVEVTLCLKDGDTLICFEVKSLAVGEMRRLVKNDLEIVFTLIDPTTPTTV